MQKLLLIATLTLATFAWAQPMADDMSQSGDNDWFSQKISQQANLSSNLLDANRQDALAQTESFNGSEEPGSMASNAGAQNTGEDWYNQKIATQSNVNRLLNGSNRQEFNTVNSENPSE
jgi:hypothetical protein